MLYHDNEEIYFTGNFENDKPNTDYGKIWDESGELWYEGGIVNGQKDGKGIEYHENGEILFEGEFSEGFPNGKVTMYHDNGMKKFTGYMEDGVKEGDGMEFDVDGYLIYRGTYKNDAYDGTNCAILYSNGRVQFIGNFVDNKKSGKVKEYFESGSLKFEGSYKDGMKEGPGVQHYDNKQRQFKGGFKKGKKHGKGQEWHENGQKYFEGEYKYGYPEGKLVSTFDSEGGLLYHGCIIDGKQQGYSVSLHKNGKRAKMGVSNSEDYMKSTTNFIIEYYPNGQIRIIGTKKLEYNGRFPIVAEHMKEHVDRKDRVIVRRKIE